MDSGPKLLLTPRETASLLAVCEKTLFTLTKQGQIPCLRLGRSVRYSLAELERWVAEQSRFGQDDAPR